MTIWLFDMTKSSIKKTNDYYEILEDNARGFFKVALDDENLADNPVFIQAKDGLIYRVKKLYRKKIQSSMESTIRFFYTDEIYTKDEFIDEIISNRINEKNNAVFLQKIKSIYDAYSLIKNQSKSLYDLWNDDYAAMIVANTNLKYTNSEIIVYKNTKELGMKSDQYGSVLYQYVTVSENNVKINGDKYYRLSQEIASKNQWIRLGFLSWPVKNRKVSIRFRL